MDRTITLKRARVAEKKRLPWPCQKYTEKVISRGSARSYGTRSSTPMSPSPPPLLDDFLHPTKKTVVTQEQSYNRELQLKPNDSNLVRRQHGTTRHVHGRPASRITTLTCPLYPLCLRTHTRIHPRVTKHYQLHRRRSNPTRSQSPGLRQRHATTKTRREC